MSTGSCVKHGWFSALAAFGELYGAACGGRSSFLDPLPSEAAGTGAGVEQAGSSGSATLLTAAVDPFGNLLLAGQASRLKAGSRELLSQHVTELGHAGFGYVLKLRADGTDVWARTTDGQVSWAAVATNDAGQVWLTGSYTNRIWMGEEELTSATASGSALLVRLNP